MVKNRLAVVGKVCPPAIQNTLNIISELLAVEKLKSHFGCGKIEISFWLWNLYGPYLVRSVVRGFSPRFESEVLDRNSVVRSVSWSMISEKIRRPVIGPVRDCSDQIDPRIC